MEYNVSIIIPHYNSPELLKVLLDSIPDKPDIQVIVVDDNSTKKQDIYESVKTAYENRVEFYVNQTGDQSAGACRNVGIDHATGKWLLFADADDYFMPGMYEMISDYFDSAYNQIMFDITSIYLDTGKLAERHIIHEKRVKDYLEDPTRKNYIIAMKEFGPWAKLTRRSVVEEHHIRYSPTRHHNDMFFSVVSAFYSDPVKIDDRKLYCITRSEGSLTTLLTERAFLCHASEYGKCYEFCKKHYNKTDVNNMGYNRLFFYHKGIQRKLKFKSIWKANGLLAKRRVPVISKNLMNPCYLFRQLYNNYVEWQKEKGYMK